VLPTFWFRNTWAWGRTGEGYWSKPLMSAVGEDGILAEQESLGRYRLHAQLPEGAVRAEVADKVLREADAPGGAGTIRAQG